MSREVEKSQGLKMFREIKRSIASHRREMLEFGCELIAIPTENPPEKAAEECARVLRDRLRCMGFPLTAVKVLSAHSGHLKEESFMPVKLAPKSISTLQFT